MKIKRIIAVIPLVAALLPLVLHSSQTGFAAVKTDIADIKDGESFIIVNDAGKNTVSKYRSGRRLSAVPLSFGSLDGVSAVVDLPDNAAVFCTETSPDGIYLKSDEGYLTSADTGNGLFFTSEKTEFGLWRFVDGKYILNVNAEFNSKKNNYLEYYPNSDFYSTYDKGSGSSDSLFKMSFYRLTGGETGKKGGAYSLPVFETSDVHGKIAEISGENTGYLLAYIADKINDKRKNDKSRAVLVDGGDVYQGSPLSNLLNGESVSAVFDRMGYDAVAVGNHEFDWGIENTTDGDATMKDYTLNGVKHENLIPLVASNLYKDGEKVRFARDYVILEKTASDGETDLRVRIAVIGFLPDYSSSILYTRFTGEGYKIYEDHAAVNRLARELEEKGLCDATLLLVHGEAEETARRLGGDTAIDLVLGGHTHRNVSGRVNGLNYVQPAAYGQAYAYAELTFEPDAENKPVFKGVRAVQTLSAAKYEMLYKNSGGEELDPDIVALTDIYTDLISFAVNREIGYITETVSKNNLIGGSGNRSNTAGNWMSSIIARAAGADIGFMNSGGVRVSLDVTGGRRVITAADVYDVFPFGNFIYCYELTYGELLTLLEYSLTQSGGSLISYMTGIDCYYGGRGVNALVMKGVPVYKNGIFADGWENKKVKVAVNEYIATSDRRENGTPNPLVAWNKTDKLISVSPADNEGALEVLKGEAEKSGGLLTVDTHAYYINGTYNGEIKSADPGEIIIPADNGEQGGERQTGDVNAPLLLIPAAAAALAVLLKVIAAAVITAVVRKKEKKQ